jgi:hypothetical protein
MTISKRRIAWTLGMFLTLILSSTAHATVIGFRELLDVAIAPTITELESVTTQRDPANPEKITVKGISKNVLPQQRITGRAELVEPVTFMISDVITVTIEPRPDGKSSLITAVFESDSSSEPNLGQNIFGDVETGRPQTPTLRWRNDAGDRVDPPANFSLKATSEAIEFKCPGNLEKCPPRLVGISGLGSITYDASLQKLSFAADRMTETGFPNDPVVTGSASVNIPESLKAGELPDGNFLFEPGQDAFFDISQGSNVFLRAKMPVLIYQAQENSFLGLLTDPMFSSSGSPWMSGLAGLLDESSAAFDPDLSLYFTYQPSENLLSMTQGFTATGISGGMDEIFVAGPVAVPEPASLALFSLGIAAFVLLGQLGARRHRYKQRWLYLVAI